ncbi:MAG: hypothetical protein IJZ74_01940 [Clostridia bacterium]|nr:hypothetical protein [Clostridia bacterium]
MRALYRILSGHVGHLPARLCRSLLPLKRPGYSIGGMRLLGCRIAAARHRPCCRLRLCLLNVLLRKLRRHLPDVLLRKLRRHLPDVLLRKLRLRLLNVLLRKLRRHLPDVLLRKVRLRLLDLLLYILRLHGLRRGRHIAALGSSVALTRGHRIGLHQCLLRDQRDAPTSCA